ncbi:E3 SUMO-protein ligase KIAA1586 homolog isoform X3 [Eschrichtius robustus]|uniref:E3 SUMO-protein ligase KIAA1586 homolog isoform X3 n=1 Tax=Eschrichtius robustus TaxID=9764 RepID=UPI0035BFE99F
MGDPGSEIMECVPPAGPEASESTPEENEDGIQFASEGPSDLFLNTLIWSVVMIKSVAPIIVMLSWRGHVTGPASPGPSPAQQTEDKAPALPDEPCTSGDNHSRTSLVAQWLRIRLPMQEIQV